MKARRRARRLTRAQVRKTLLVALDQWTPANAADVTVVDVLNLLGALDAPLQRWQIALWPACVPRAARRHAAAAAGDR